MFIFFCIGNPDWRLYIGILIDNETDNMSKKLKLSLLINSLKVLPPLETIKHKCKKDNIILSEINCCCEEEEDGFYTVQLAEENHI